MTQAPDPKPPLPPADLEALTRSLGDYAAQLTELMTAETEVLRTRRLAGSPAFQQEKQRLTAAYGETCAVVKANQAGFAALPDALKEAVRVKLERLTVASQENASALNLMQSATERVMNIVVRAVREHRAAIVGYTRHSTPPLRVPGGLGLALDRSF
ncbi:MAG: flagellar protein FlgN [Rhodospirillales bacterium]|jgi:hypothetical protein|nr:flagellar protein FlgN [Rhodospirillales bacterium]